jgi:hypothetical protein
MRSKEGIMCAQFERWYCIPSELVGLTPQRARDLIVECFFQAQREMLERSAAGMGLDTDLEAIRAQAEAAVRDALVRTGGDFENPDKASLDRAVESLLATARDLGTPSDIMRHHEQQIAMMLEGLGD